MTKNVSDAPGDAAPSGDRRQFLKTASVLGAAGAVAGATHGKFGLAPITQAQAQTTAAAPPAKWWPSKWGPTDEAGSSNHITPAKVLDAVKSIKDGKIYKIGRTYEQGMPLFGARAFTLRIPGSPTGGPFSSNKLVYHDEYLSTEIGQVGTQFDGLGHIGIPTRRRRRQGADALLQRLYGVGDRRRLRPEETRQSWWEPGTTRPPRCVAAIAGGFAPTRQSACRRCARGAGRSTPLGML